MTSEELLEDIENSANVRADMQDIMILTDGVLETGEETLGT
jgi:hypothetical protein